MVNRNKEKIAKQSKLEDEKYQSMTDTDVVSSNLLIIITKRRSANARSKPWAPGATVYNAKLGTHKKHLRQSRIFSRKKAAKDKE